MALNTVGLLNLLHCALIHLVAAVVRPVPFPCRTLAGEPIANVLHLNGLRCAPHVLDRCEIPGDDFESPVD